MKLLSFVACCLAAAFSHADPSVLGQWASEVSIIQISQDGEQLSARVVALMEPTYVEGEQFGPVGAVRRDDLNPDETLRTRPILGLELLSEYTFDGKRWEGKIYDPESGNTYSSRMSVDRHGNLKMRGYIGVPLLGRTATFEPATLCTNRMREMFERSEASVSACD